MARKKNPSGIAFRDLQKVASELNGFLDGNGNKIKTTGIKGPALEKLIKEAAEAVLVPDDEISPLAGELFEKLNVVLSNPDEPAPVLAPEEEEEILEEEEEEIEEEEEPEEELLNEDVAAPSLKQLQKVASELNSVLKLTDIIPAKSKDDSLLIDEIMDVCDGIEDNEFAKSVFSKDVVATMEMLGAIVFAWKDDAKKKQPEKKKPATNGKKGITLATVGKFIKEGKYTRKELTEKVLEELPHLSPNTVVTTVSDGKNPKYNKFDKLVVISEKGIVSFAK